MKKALTALLLIAGLIAAFALFRNDGVNAQKTEKRKRPTPPVETAKVIKQELSEKLSLFGNVRAQNSATVRAEVLGAVISFDKDVGDRVKQGESICKIDPGKYRIALNLARAELQMAVAGLEKAELNEKRMTTLHKKDVASLEKLQEKVLDRKMAEAETDSRKADVSQAERDLRLTSVNAPYDGYIAGKYLHRGDWVRPGDPVLDIVDLSSVYVYVDLPEKDLGRFRLKSSARVWLDAYPGMEFKGVVTHIAPRAPQKTRNFTIRVVFNDPGGLARDGRFARVDVISEKRKVIMVPKDEVIERGPLKMVFIVNNGKASQVMVKVLRQVEDMREVR
ncbi:MAG: hypothetical protein IEMM0002_1535 [bacterium]|nr:MAG: hypothetical protein IEMM0002_1535 [bacterium]